MKFVIRGSIEWLVMPTIKSYGLLHDNVRLTTFQSPLVHPEVEISGQGMGPTTPTLQDHKIQ